MDGPNAKFLTNVARNILTCNRESSRNASPSTAGVLARHTGRKESSVWYSGRGKRHTGTENVIYFAFQPASRSNCRASPRTACCTAASSPGAKGPGPFFELPGELATS